MPSLDPLIPRSLDPSPAKLATEHLDVFYGSFHAVQDVSIGFAPRAITAIIGPSGCGKSTLLRSLNRMNELVDGARIRGRILLDNADIYAINVLELRKRVGMVFQRPNAFPLSIFDNIAYGPRLHGTNNGSELQAIVERCLRAVRMWDEVKDKLLSNALRLTDEQRQRLCIARMLAVEPEVLLMDEPCSALDPIATLHIEELMRQLKEQYCIAIVTHNMQQAARASDYCGFMLLGVLKEFGETAQIFTNPKQPDTENYISGRFG
ncbi:phosphate ABC transporter ATP-binding protein [candidate division WOR-3 bacterium]|nr:phosphate ABC transporter ATP-binding protein [candidate division WOR-3 bacterium]